MFIPALARTGVHAVPVVAGGSVVALAPMPLSGVPGPGARIAFWSLAAAGHLAVAPTSSVATGR